MEMQMEMSYVFAVVITGLVVVFLGLVLLIAFISIIGEIFKKLNQKDIVPAKTNAPAVKPVPQAAVQPAAAASDTDDDEIIAVISAAVAMMSAADGKNYRVRSVRVASSKAHGGNAWASAGLRESTNPF